jgi:hypothetical protein
MSLGDYAPTHCRYLAILVSTVGLSLGSSWGPTGPWTAIAVAAEPLSRYAWPPLGMDKTIALGEALRTLPKSHVVVWCPDMDCLGLQSDLDDAFQIAEWESDFDRRRVESNDEPGLFVGPVNGAAQELASVIERTTGIHVKVVSTPETSSTINLIIGKRPWRW